MINDSTRNAASLDGLQHKSSSNGRCDPREVAEALGLLVDPTAHVEIRVFGKASKVSSKVFPCDKSGLKAASSHAAYINDTAKPDGVYVTINPIVANPGGKGGAARDADVIRRLWLPIDVDPKRAAKTSATDAEKAEAGRIVEAIIEFLGMLGWPDPIICDSGNGFHLLYAIELPNDEPSRDLIHAVLKALAHRFNTESASIDLAVFNAGRVFKLYGTTARKGQDTPDRPHRKAKVISGRRSRENVTTDMMTELVLDLTPEPEPEPKPKAELMPFAERGTAKPSTNGERPKDEPSDDWIIKPGDAFNANVSWTDLMVQAGWTKVGDEPGGGIRWSRPGKGVGVSAVSGHDGGDTLKIFSSTPGETFPGLSTNGTHTKFHFYAHVFHGGDYTKATRHLLAKGFGESKAKDKAKNDRNTGDRMPERKANQPEDRRTQVEINTRRDLVIADTMAVLPKDPGLFSRCDTLVILEREIEDTVKFQGGVEMRKMQGSVKVSNLDAVGLGCRLPALIDFYSWHSTKGGEEIARPAHPPDWLCKGIIGRLVFPGVRKLRGVAEIPFVLPDGSIFSKAGWDPSTGFYYAPSIRIGRIPDRPSRKAAEDAASALLDLVDQFPFVSEADKAVWLADLLTVVQRPTIDGPTPGFAYVGNAPGVGKGKLIDLIGVIATGRVIPTTTYPANRDEAAKVRVAIAVAAKGLVHLDNLEEGDPYGSGPLDSTITSMEIDDRILGASKNTGATKMILVWHLSGNKIYPGKDAHRRWLPCNIYTALETPEERGDLRIPNLIEYAKEHQAELVRHALIILKAHAIEGRPTGGWAPLGSFEAWDPIIRGAVHYATGLDCNLTRKVAAKDAPDRQYKLALLEAWARLPGGGPDGNGVTSEQAIKWASQPDDCEVREALAEAIVRFSKDGKLPTPRMIGNQIRAMAGATIDGRAFIKVSEIRRSALWRVENV